MQRFQLWRRCALAVAVIAGTACGGKDGGAEPVDGGGDTPPDAGKDAAVRDAAPDARRDSTPFTTITPTTLMLDASMPQPVQFQALLPDGSPSTQMITWTVTPKELGSIDANGLFTPSGASGELKITAQAGSVSVTITVPITVRVTQSGDPDYGTIPSGAGGVGGVGGEGGGSQITDPALRTALDAEATDDPSLAWLYPYDGTVWPRELPAPLLQWKIGSHTPVAVKLAISVDEDFQTTLYLGPPKDQATFNRIPIPQAVWRNAQLSGKTMKLSLTYVANEGGLKTYKMPKQITWVTAPTTLKGTVYYNSYGTKLAENYGGAKGGNGRFGGATLGIQGGSYDPKLVAGKTSSDTSGCRVCHTVSADGSTLIAMRDESGRASSAASIYDLRTGVERIAPQADDGKFGWAALTPDGTAALGAAGPPSEGGANAASLSTSAVYRTADGATLTANGLSSVVVKAVTPSFSPDGRKVAFNLYQGMNNIGGTLANGKSLIVMDVARPDANSFTFSNPVPVFTAYASSQMPGWPFFLPDNSGVVFELELASNGGEHLMTRISARGELWWTDLAGNAHALDAANGKNADGTSYLPAGPNGHADDTVFQYEPTVAPIIAGGYAWVGFTSRRLYGNVATRNPYESDPRGYDLNPGNPGGPTTKKLWVTAISLPVTPGTDPSHPAFYLPAQELYAGNSRGFWALDVCKPDGQPCSGGDECCNGYCDQTLEVPVCGMRPPNACAAEYDACSSDADCCAEPNGPVLTCVANHCAGLIIL